MQSWQNPQAAQATGNAAGMAMPGMGGMTGMAGMPGMAGMGPSMGGDMMGGMAGMGGMDMMKGCGKGKKGAPDVKEELGQYVGIIKSFSETTGYGFISCNDLAQQGNGDIFLHHQQAAGFQVGSTVAFTAYTNSKGQLRAKDLVAL